MKNYQVSKANELITAGYKLDKNEIYLLLACISQVDSRVEADTVTTTDEFIIRIEDMKNIFYDGDKDNNAYKVLRAASNSLFDREVTIVLPNNEKLRTRFVSSVLFQPDQYQITITFAQKILPYLTQLHRNFTTYKLVEVIDLTSVHAIRLYELIVCWEGQNRRSELVDLEDFKFIMGITGKYKQFGQLRESVIEVAMKQINEYTDYTVTATYRKVQRAYKSITFEFYRKTNMTLISRKNIMSPEKIKAIVRTKQFMADYNNHKLLSLESRQTNVEFWAKAEQLLVECPEQFNKREFDDYFKIQK